MYQSPIAERRRAADAAVHLFGRKAKLFQSDPHLLCFFDGRLFCWDRRAEAFKLIMPGIRYDQSYGGVMPPFSYTVIDHPILERGDIWRALAIFVATFVDPHIVRE